MLVELAKREGRIDMGLIWTVLAVIGLIVVLQMIF